MAWRTLSRLRTLADAFARDVRGNAAIVMVAGIAAFMGLAGTGFDFAMFHAQKQALQRGADAGALAAARELALLASSRKGVQHTAEAFALQEIGAAMPLESVAVETEILDHGKGVRVIVSGLSKPLMTFFALDSSSRIQARAEANLVGGTPLCALALAPVLPNAISLSVNARIVAEECAVYSNSESELGIVALNNAELETALTCSAGGYKGLAANFSPEPITDCPRLPDPLSGRPEPVVGSCDYTAKVITGGTSTLSPGVYCGGLNVMAGANVTLTPGTYIMKNGPLLVGANASLRGEYVGFFFKGAAAQLIFLPSSHIDLTAPKAGPLAGLLLFGDRATLSRTMLISSNDARNLLGTIYLPHGILKIDASRPVADRSAYTVIVAERIVVKDGPTLVLNADYDGTDVPVPNGVGPRPATPALTR